MFDSFLKINGESKSKKKNSFFEKSAIEVTLLLSLFLMNNIYTL